jgi:hypothetical protein
MLKCQKKYWFVCRYIHLNVCIDTIEGAIMTKNVLRAWCWISSKRPGNVLGEYLLIKVARGRAG